ncbi:MAG TPA: cyclic peptide export ABC transporter [Candidatus Angelobacter sp.]|jgi:putative ATP-binding cassette transporter|nr:cyclic peptide export ABC transporter [Candidatus Angelobacter sp.]
MFSVKLFKTLFRRSQTLVILAIVASIANGLGQGMAVAIIGRILNHRFENATVVGALFVSICLFVPLTRFTAQILLAQISQSLIFDLRLQLTARCLAAPLRHLETLGAARLMATLTDDIQSIGNAFTLFPIICSQLVIVVACLAYLGYLSWPALIVLLVSLTLAIGGFKFLIKRARRQTSFARGFQDSLFGHFRAVTEGTKELKLHRNRRARFLSHMLELTASSQRRHIMKATKYYATASGWGNFMFLCTVGTMIFILPRIIPMSNMALTGAVLIILFLVAPLDVLSSLLPALGNAEVALKKVESLGLSLEASAIEKESSLGQKTSPKWQSIELAGVTHSYRRENSHGDFTIGPVDLKLTPGELVFVTGGNGSGKTTLAKLITGLYAPESGIIYLDGKAVTDGSRDEYRQHFSMVFTDFFLFDTLLGLESPAIDEKAQGYLEKLELDHKITVRDGVLSSTDLSQGQRKRLALLTAYLEDRPIYVFDEWAADQDPVFKEVFYRQLLPELKAKGKTVLAITHDDRYYSVADRVIKLYYGKLEYDLDKDDVMAAV